MLQDLLSRPRLEAGKDGGEGKWGVTGTLSSLVPDFPECRAGGRNENGVIQVAGPVNVQWRTEHKRTDNSESSIY